MIRGLTDASALYQWEGRLFFRKSSPHAFHWLPRLPAGAAAKSGREWRLPVTAPPCSLTLRGFVADTPERSH